MIKINRKLTALCAVASMATFLVACNTVRGVGEDVESGGQKLQHVANTHQSPSNQAKGKQYHKRTTTTTYNATTSY